MLRHSFLVLLLSTAAPAAGVRRFWSATDDAEVSWLGELQEQGVLAELQGLADRDLSDGLNGHPQFVADFGPNGNLTEQAGGWTAIVLQNKGELSAEGCRAAPL